MDASPEPGLDEDELEDLLVRLRFARIGVVPINERVSARGNKREVTSERFLIFTHRGGGFTQIEGGLTQRRGGFTHRASGFTYKGAGFTH
jgi:hypothetical protein